MGKTSATAFRRYNLRRQVRLAVPSKPRAKAARKGKAKKAKKSKAKAKKSKSKSKSKSKRGHQGCFDAAAGLNSWW